MNLITILFCVVSVQGAGNVFPDDFIFGVATSAYQIEGGWNEDGKGPSIWDTHCLRPSAIQDGTSGSSASDSYHQRRRDVEMLRELGVDFYRLSVSWSRVMPTGFPNEINELGLLYYENLINDLLKYNIQPMITMYHFDLPQYLQDLGGWTNPLTADWFEDYARVLFTRFGEKVPFWVTFNQPDSICFDGYGVGTLAPGVKMAGLADYLCVKNVLLANARAWRLYDREYRSRFKGTVGISVAVNWVEAVDNSTENLEAAHVYREFMIGLYMNPIFSKEGDYPKVVRDIVASRSQAEGFPRSRLPALSTQEIEAIRGSADFLAMNHYTSYLARRGGPRPQSFQVDGNVSVTQDPAWVKAKSPWLRRAPDGLRKACRYLSERYNRPVVYVTENGWSTDEGLMDEERVENLRVYLNAVLSAIEEGTDVRGYAVWSLMDNFEWAAGYTERFGLYEVDFDSPLKTRTARKSALVYKEIINSRVIDRSYEPQDLNITISARRVRKRINAEL